MNSIKKIRLNNLCIVAGCGLIIGALVLLVFWYASAAVYETRCEEYVDTLNEILPDTQNAAPEKRLNNTMPILAAKEKDFVALLEFPAFGSTLPVCNDWGKPNAYPCRFTGSVYNNTLVIGSSDRKGQMDYVKELSVGDSLYITDMTGNRYTYQISDILISKDVDRDTLCSSDAQLTIFVKHSMNFEYTILRCDVKA